MHTICAAAGHSLRMIRAADDSAAAAADAFVLLRMVSGAAVDGSANGSVLLLTTLPLHDGVASWSRQRWKLLPDDFGAAADISGAAAVGRAADGIGTPAHRLPTRSRGRETTMRRTKRAPTMTTMRRATTTKSLARTMTAGQIVRRACPERRWHANPTTTAPPPTTTAPNPTTTTGTVGVGVGNQTMHPLNTPAVGQSHSDTIPDAHAYHLRCRCTCCSCPLEDALWHTRKWREQHRRCALEAQGHADQRQQDLSCSCTRFVLQLHMI